MILQTRWHFSIVFIFILFTISFASAKENTVVSMEENSTSKNLNTEKSNSKRIIGTVENIRLVPPNVVLKARIDTGAKTTSIDARNITPFERDGKQWVRFVSMAKNKEYPIERKIIKHVQIKRHGAAPQDRYVVNMRIVLGDVSRLILVSLNDRDAYQYPILIGRNFLRDFFIVDVAKKDQLKPMVLPK